ncbi:MAG TPA: nitrate reductase subunit beta [Thermoanaerobaculia bacterium]|nr:nitrate reductase subunit beta [Thermoanaerobaculia bacterium]
MVRNGKPDVRAHVSMVFHLDKCIGCHTCSLACKNLWTERQGAEYMWWNNVETKPGTGYPTKWEEQQTWKGGWSAEGDQLSLRSQGKVGGLFKLFYNPNQPGLDDYYEPWTYRYSDLFDAPAGDDQPSARPVSQITGKTIDIEAGPNWDDDLSGSKVYAENDPNLASLDDDRRRALFDVERLTMMYLPRLCNHCTNPACVASCPSGALYKRGEDGIVLVNQEQCRGWRACVVGCPYKKVYYNWKTGKSEKCILCYPRLETGQPPACFHSCVGRIRYMGVILYDASRIKAVASVPAEKLVDAQRSLLLDASDPNVIAAAEANGVSRQLIEAAQSSPVWKFVREWGLALPLHPEYRTLPMLFYVPPLVPVMGTRADGIYGRADGDGIFNSLDDARLPISYLASLFSAGNTGVVASSLRKLLAVRWYRRSLELDDAGKATVSRVLNEAGLTVAQANAIYRLTALSTLSERFVLPPLQREAAIHGVSAEECRQNCGLGEIVPPGRGA